MEKADILVQKCAILPMGSRSLIEDGALAVKDGKIIYVGRRSSISGMTTDLKIDGKGMVAMPGLVNCHTHIPMTLFRGAAEDKPLADWLKERIWPLEANLREKDVYDGSLLGCLEMIRGGTTCFGDAYFHEVAVARAVENSGLRAVLAQGIVGSGNKDLGMKMLGESVRFAERFRGYAGGRVVTMLGPHSAYSCSPDLLWVVSREAARLKVDVHLHVAESERMFRRCKARYGRDEVQFLEGLSFLGDNVLAAHCIDLSGEDRRILARRKVRVAYCPVSNMKLGLGIARMKDLVDLGVSVGLGTDGAASNNSLDMFGTMKFGALLQKMIYRDPVVFGARDVLEMATLGGARALGLDGVIGELAVGRRADVILVDLEKPHLKPLHDVCSSLVYSASSDDVDTVIVDGKVLMEHSEVKTLDEQSVMERAEKAALDLASR